MKTVKIIGISTDPQNSHFFGKVFNAVEYAADPACWLVASSSGDLLVHKYVFREIPNFRDTTSGGFKYAITDYINMFGFVYFENSTRVVSAQWDEMGKCTDFIGLVPDEIEKDFRCFLLDLVVGEIPIEQSVKFDGPSIIEAELIAIKKRLDDLESVNKSEADLQTLIIAVAKEPTAGGKYPTSVGIAIYREEELYGAYPKHSFNYIKFNPKQKED